ncbi:MAG: ATP-grasp domain-containing protein [Pseudomonadota bacterium]
MQKTIIIIDPMVSSGYLIQRFNEFGYGVIAFLTMDIPERLKGFSYTQFPFAKIIEASGDLSKDIREIKSPEQYTIVAGFTGVDSAINYGERVLKTLFPAFSNNPATSSYRSNKFMMNDVIKKHNLPYIQHETIDYHLDDRQKIEQTVAFYRRYKQIVIRPVTGSGASVNVFSPKNETDIANYFKKFEPYFFKSDFLLQEKVFGPEYYINCASYKGRHYITTIGQYVKTEVNGTFEYERLDAVEKDSAEYLAIRTYILDCLNALGMLNGLSHTEIIMTNKGPRLIELNPRISGMYGCVNMMAKRRYDVDQISAYINLLENKKIPNSNRQVYQRIFIFKNKKGNYHNIDLSAIKQLGSYISHRIINPKCLMDDKSEESLLSIVMCILLEHPDKKVIEQDCDILSDLEKRGSCLI